MSTVWCAICGHIHDEPFCDPGEDTYLETVQREARATDVMVAKGWMLTLDRLDTEVQARTHERLECGVVREVRSFCRNVLDGKISRPFSQLHDELTSDIWRHLSEDHGLAELLSAIMDEPAIVAHAEQVQQATEAMERLRPKGRG